jgi:hypothetical protein
MTTCTRRLIALLVIASLAGGCTGFRHAAIGPSRLSHPPVAPGRVAAGETVRVELRDGTRRTITIKAIEADALVGERGERIARAQIVGLTRPTSIVGHVWRFVGLYCAVILLQVIVFGLYDE